MSFVVRQLLVSDAEAFRTIRLEALQDSPDAFGGDFAEESRQPIAAFTRQITDSAVFGAFRDDALIGVTGLFWSDGAKTRHKGHLYTVYVTPKARGTGCALPLIEAALAHAEKLGKVQVLLGAAVDNTAALALYRRAGFEIYGTEPRGLHVNGRYIDEHLMVRFLEGTRKEDQNG